MVVRADVERRLLALAPNVRGALWILLASVLFIVMATLVKHLGAYFDIFQIAFFRALFGLTAILPFVLRRGVRGLRTGRPGMQLLRGCSGTAAMFCGYYAFTQLPLADAISISYARTLFIIPLAVIFLGEVVRRRRWTATAIGFVGVLVMLRPGAGIETATLIAVMGALLAAASMTAIKLVSKTDSADVTVFYFGIISTPLTLLPALYVWRAPEPLELVLLIASGAVAASAQYCMIRGYRIGEATAVVPFDYARLLIGTVVGIVIFAELPDAWTLVGAGIIVVSTLYIALREARLKQ